MIRPIDERRIASDSDIAAPGGVSILLTHGARTPRAVVLLHAFTDSPRQFSALAELARLTAAELCRAGDAAVDVATGLGDSVIVVGLTLMALVHGERAPSWLAVRR
jgi:hypothetical protein